MKNFCNLSHSIEEVFTISMSEPIFVDEEEDKSTTSMSRKEKRKETKKKKRREKRREIAEKEREEEEAKLNDPEALKMMELLEEEDRERVERERKEFEERERIWLEKKRKDDEEEEERLRRTKVLQDLEIDKVDDNDEGSDWEYVEEGPAEIIWQGNEIIVKKKKVRVPKKNVHRNTRDEDADRPTSNPLPPLSEAFADYKNASVASAHEVYENVAQQVPNFGTEQDKSHCPFHIKTGACRFGQRCSRVHFYPDKACTLLIKNMYNGPGLAWEQDEGLEYTDEEVERCYEEFYEDVHTEFLKFGEIVNFKACRNGSFHLRGNVYVHYKSLDSAMLAYQFINGRYFAGKQVTCEFVGVTRWKIAICGEYMKSSLMTCSRGTACNFIHCFRNPGGDYEWADWDKPPPRYWAEKMAALFGYSDEFCCEKQMEHESLRSSSQMITADADRRRSRRSKSRETDCLSTGFGRSHYDRNGLQKSAHRQDHRSDDRKQIKVIDEKKYEERTNFIDYHHRKRETRDTDSDIDLSIRDRDGGRDRDRHDGHAKKSSRRRNKVLEFPDDYGDNGNRTREPYSDKDWSDKDNERGIHQGRTRKSSIHMNKVPGVPENHGHRRKRTNDTDSGGDWSDRDRDGHKNHRHQKKVSDFSDDYGDNENMIVEADRDRDKETRHGRTRKSTRHRHRELGVLDDHGGKSKRAHDTDSGGDWSDRDKGIKKHHTRKRIKSRHQNDFSGLVHDNGDSKNKTDSRYKWLERDREKDVILETLE